MTGSGFVSSLALVLAAAFAASSLLVIAQPRPAAVRARPRAARKQGTQSNGQKGGIRFGDITLSTFKTMDVNYDQGFAKVVGANSTIDAVDANDPSATTRLQASEFIAYLAKDDLQKVERVEAVGNVRYSTTRPAKGGGTMLLRGTGAKGTYWKQDGRMRLDGPADFYGEQPAKDGKAKQSVTGKAGVVTYDQGKQALTLSGGVDLKLVMPGAIIGEAPVSADTIVIDMASRPYNYHITNNEPGDNSIKFRPDNQPKEKPKEEKKSP